jgi:hypothetical protein
MAQLTLIDKSGGEKSFTLRAESLTLGRSGDNQISIPDSAISRHHAEILMREGTWFIRDLSSRNGVLINGNRYQESELRDGDMVTIGESSLRFESQPRSGFGPLHWVPVVKLELPWPVSPGLGLADDPLAGEAIVSLPVADGPLLPDETVLGEIRREELLQRALHFQEIHATFLSASDAGVLWADVLAISRRLTDQPWAGALVPGGDDEGVRLQMHGQGWQTAEVPRLLIEAAVRSVEAVHWSTATDQSGLPLEAVFAVPWRTEEGLGGVIFGPSNRHTPDQIGHTLELLAGLALEIGHWWPTISSRWMGEQPPRRRPSTRPLTRPQFAPPPAL